MRISRSLDENPVSVTGNYRRENDGNYQRNNKSSKVYMTPNKIIIGILMLVILTAWTSPPIREGMNFGVDDSKSFPHLLAVQQNNDMLNDAIEKTKALSKPMLKDGSP